MIPWITLRNRASKISCKELYPRSDVLTNLGSSHKHSSYSSSFPIYLFTQKEKEVVDEDAGLDVGNKEDEPTMPEETNPDEDEAVVEEVSEDRDENPPAPKMKKMIIDEWEQLNAQPPIWTRCAPLLASIGPFFNCP